MSLPARTPAPPTPPPPPPPAAAAPAAAAAADELATLQQRKAAQDLAIERALSIARVRLDLEMGEAQLRALRNQEGERERERGRRATQQEEEQEVAAEAEDQQAGYGHIPVRYLPVAAEAQGDEVAEAETGAEAEAEDDLYDADDEEAEAEAEAEEQQQQEEEVAGVLLRQEARATATAAAILVRATDEAGDIPLDYTRIEYRHVPMAAEADTEAAEEEHSFSFDEASSDHFEDALEEQEQEEEVAGVLLRQEARATAAAAAVLVRASDEAGDILLDYTRIGYRHVPMAAEADTEAAEEEHSFPSDEASSDRFEDALEEQQQEEEVAGVLLRQEARATAAAAAVLVRASDEAGDILMDYTRIGYRHVPMAAEADIEAAEEEHSFPSDEASSDRFEDALEEQEQEQEEEGYDVEAAFRASQIGGEAALLRDEAVERLEAAALEAAALEAEERAQNAQLEDQIREVQDWLTIEDALEAEERVQDAQDILDWLRMQEERYAAAAAAVEAEMAAMIEDLRVHDHRRGE
ncbi:uncharacterized protein L3040_000831 [Drepanopeziza brunnea f. sp. 'multigermtubi']|uniref:uncharacterized protein n=1 Tax=Drepanopeziza brunnea f. sp. 'multigermtubi' TaxID=698441 RepID=UPI00238C6296|nr:hypothetical protein L3040_000831 [Drepanopeziza brunnea f. sp. 'multigermtubi']